MHISSTTAASVTVPPLRTTPDRSSPPPAIMPPSSSDSRGGPVERNARNEAELIARIRGGDEAAFEALFRAHAVALRAFVLEYVKSRDVAVEVVHDVFLQIWRRRERLEIRESLQAYIYRAARNRALDVVNRDAREQRYVEDTMRDSDADEVARGPASAQQVVEQHDLAAAMERVVAEFPERRRMVFMLRWKSGLRHEEIAELLDISKKTVENQMTRALRALRARLAPYL